MQRTCLGMAMAVGLSVSGCATTQGTKTADQPVGNPVAGSSGGIDWGKMIGESGGGNPSARIGVASIDSLAMEGAAASPKISEFLGDPSLEVRRKAVDALAKFGKDASPALPKMAQFATSSNPEIRATAVQALAQVGAAEARGVLSEAKKDSHSQVRVWAHVGLVKLGDDCQDHMEDVAELLASGKLSLPLDGAQALEIMACPNEEVIETLLGAARKGDDKVRSAAIRAVGALGNRAVDAVALLLTETLSDKNGMIRQETLLALTKMGAKALPVLEALIKALRDPLPRHRELAAVSLGNIGPQAKSAVPPLRKALTDPEVSVQAAAKRAMMSIDPAALAPPPVVAKPAAAALDAKAATPAPVEPAGSTVSPAPAPAEPVAPPPVDPQKKEP